MGARIDAHDDLWPRGDLHAADDDVLDLVDAQPLDRPGDFGWTAPLAALLLSGLWIGGMLWLALPALPALPPVELAQFIAALAVVPALIGIVWLLARRTSRAEARRFGASAQAMRTEAAALERRVASLSRTLASHREQLVVQLDAGAAASGRLEAIGMTMADRIAEAQSQAASLAEAADRARGTVGELIAAMPRARAESEEVGRRLDQAGLTAAAQAAALEAQLLALGERAREADETALASATRLAEEIARIDAAALDGSAKLERTVAEAAGAIRLHSDAAARLLDEQVGRLGDAGTGASVRLGETIEGMSAALDVFVRSAADRLGEHVERLDAAGQGAGGRLARVAGELAETIEALVGRSERATEDARHRAEERAEALVGAITEHQATLDAGATASVDALAARLRDVDLSIARLAERLDGQRGAADHLVGDLTRGLDDVTRQLDSLHAQGVERSQLLAASISALGGSADAMTEALRAGDAMAQRTMGSTEALLVALDAAAREIDDTLPEALDRLDARIGASRGVVAQAKPELLALVTAAESTHDAIEAIAGVVAEQRRSLDQLSATLLETLTQGRAKADALGEMVDDTIGRSHRFADEAAPRLLDALLRVRETAQTAADRARDALATVIPEAASALEQASAEAMRRAAGDTVQRQVDAIGDAAEGAVAAATRATERLAAQVHQIAEQTALVETRLEEAKSERESADRDSLARRVSLLIEALNSASIDIARAFAPDIADSAWAAYLKGDRGVFTRRAVRLLDGGDAREIARLYDGDARFREHVNRYIHDFEGMLRAILSQRDGQPLSVTLLSSDMGKLYVALAQAIERLR
ncbi:hypothetical protein GCM10011380_24420 [Sphingomonas metalli]|uniref:ATPase n=1 Tax=Sphingomonas metalli TaxID=1779358 RepID=A0A916T734_9SPHN|nr:methyl-accepting chemotaxis protein [Sphingomonas metalli]GGB34108.1 hypothetical protein GCM10011380_24420 [Sphingomonas metalli]